MGNRQPPGFTLIEVVVGVTIAAVLAFAFYASIGGSETPTSSAEDRARRAGDAATVLFDIATAIASLETTNPPVSYLQTVGAYPNSLSQLTTAITIAQRNSCNRVTDAYRALPVPDPPTEPGYVQGWNGPYYRIDFVPGSNTQIAEGFILEDDLIRAPANPPNNPKADELFGRLALRMNGVTQLDAQALDAVVDFTVSGTGGTIRYGAGDPTTVDYSLTVSGC